MSAPDHYEGEPSDERWTPPRAGPQPRASVIVPTFNHADILPLCLNALLAQTLPPEAIEIIVVDDGSSDATPTVLADYAARFPRVRAFRQHNQGPAAARNLGAREAHGEFLLFTDDDCEPTPSWVEEMLRPFEEDPILVGVKGAYRTRQTGVVARFAQIEFETRYRKLERERYIDFVDSHAAAFRREIFLSLRGFDTRFPKANNEDTEFSYRVAAAGFKMAFNPKALVYHRHPDTLFRYLKVKFGRAYWRMIVYRAYPEKMRSDSYTPQTLKLQILLMLLAAMLGLGGVFYRPLWWGLPIIGLLFALSLMPFLVVLIDWPPLTRAWSLPASLGRRLARMPWLRALASCRLYDCVRNGLRAVGNVLHACAAVGFRILRPAVQGAVFPLLRCAWRSTWALVDGCSRVGRAIGRGLGEAVRATGRTVRARARAWAAGKMGIWTRARLRSLTQNRLFMAGAAIVMILLRGMAMAGGVLWAAVPHGNASNRFSQAAAVVLADILAVSFATALAYATKVFLLDHFFNAPDVPVGFAWHYLPFVVAIFLFAFYMGGLYRPSIRSSPVNEFVNLFKTVTLVGLVLAILIYLAGIRHTRLILVPTCFNAILLTLVFRSLVRRSFGRRAGNGREKTRTRMLIVGTGEMGRLVCRRLRRDRAEGYDVLGFVSQQPGESGTRIEGLDVLGSFDQLAELIDRLDVQDVFLASPMLTHDETLELVHRHGNKPGVRFHVVSNIFDLISTEIDLVGRLDMPVASLRNESAPLFDLLAKRAFDVTVSAGILILAMPLWLLIALAIRLETDGPALFRQERIGLRGRPFDILKFRTMFADTEKFQLSPSSRDDRRITRIGRFLRRTSLDEFPQLINVLKGEMSLVGPRPEMPFIVERYQPWERKRLDVKPGLTGLWQIMGRKDLPLHECLEYDFYYIKNRSLLMDLGILLKTIPVVFSGRGAF